MNFNYPVLSLNLCFFVCFSQLTLISQDLEAQNKSLRKHFQVKTCNIEHENLKGSRIKNCYTLSDFRNKTVDKNLVFKTSQFQSPALFRRASFKEKANFFSSRFKSNSDFSYCNFPQGGVFDFSILENDGRYTGARINELLSFKNTLFKGSGIFFQLISEKNIDFSRSKISRDLTFWNATLKGGINLTETEIDSVLDFTNTTLGPSNFYDLRLPDALIFNGTKIQKFIDLSFVRDNPNAACHLLLYNVPIDSFKFDYSQFELANKHVFVHGDSLRYPPQIIEKTYNDIMRMQKKYNYILGYRKADVHYQYWKLRNGFFYEKYIFLPIRKWWDAFGYGKDLIITNTFILFSFFFFITLTIFPYLVTKVYNPESLSGLRENLMKNPVNYRKVSHIIRLMPYALFYTVIIFFGLRMELNNFRISGNPNYYIFNWKKKIFGGYVLLMYSIGLICTAYLANYIISS